MSKASLALLVVVTASLIPSPWTEVAALQKGPVNTGPGTLAAARKYLEGRWSLISFEVHPPGKPVIHVAGAGTLTYDGFGNMQMELRVPESVVEPLRVAGVPTEKGVLSLGGRTAVDMQSRTLTFFLERQPPLGAPSGPLALNRPRHWEVEGTTLTLTTKDSDGQPLSIGRWRKSS
jgi:hypothetical protein